MTVKFRVAVRSLFLGLAALACVTPLIGEPPTTAVHVLSATLDPATHVITVQLLNTSIDKTAVAYDLGTKGFDSAGKQVEDSGVGWDYLSPDPTPDSTSHYILPGKTVSAMAMASQDVVSVQMSVIGVVYLDRTFEGPASALVFDTRTRQARAARQALAILQFYPATLTATRKTMQALLAIESPLVSGVIANSLHLDAMPDLKHPIAESSLPKNNQQWDEITAELTRQAAFFEAQSQGMKQ